MKKLTHIFFGIILFSAIMGCGNSIEDTQTELENPSAEHDKISVNDIEISVDYINTGTYLKGGPGDEKVNVYNLITHVKNISRDTVFISAWSCSKEYQFVVDDTLNYSIHSYMNCYKNGPTIVTILPDSSYDAPIMVKFAADSKKKPFRIGLIHNRYDKLPPKNKFIELGIKWSNKITPENDTHNIK